MKITTEQLYSRLAGLQKLFSYKRQSKIDIANIAAISKQIYVALKFRPRVEFILRNYVELASLISSDKLKLHAVDLYFLGTYVKTGKFSNMSEVSTEADFRQAYEFYSANEITRQVQLIKEKSESLNTSFAKFTKTNKSIFELRENQTNELYDMLVAGKINLYVFAYFLSQGKFKIDFSKIHDIEIFRILKIADYVSRFEITDILI